jgi:hypothetical protein
MTTCDRVALHLIDHFDTELEFGDHIVVRPRSRDGVVQPKARSWIRDSGFLDARDEKLLIEGGDWISAAARRHYKLRFHGSHCE